MEKGERFYIDAFESALHVLQASGCGLGECMEGEECEMRPYNNCIKDAMEVSIASSNWLGYLENEGNDGKIDSTKGVNYARSIMRGYAAMKRFSENGDIREQMRIMLLRTDIARNVKDM